ncbi:hypothetical protein BJ170DRAFT_596026 [Xylariales sp. AK1849]|nr:hypothetical protein BJ170DRAFT_596026 [Xylariales sp. AK1849]
MASTAGFPLHLHQDELSILLLSDSEDEDAPPTPREPAHSRDLSTPESIEQHEEAMRKKTKNAASNVPLHPIPAMQPAFAESLIEATANPALQKPKLRFGDAKARRTRLLDAEKDARLHAELWRYRPGQSHHELWKLMAQISFGVYLLLNGIANSNIQVVNILQGHIDEVDEFLEIAMEDVKLAMEDVQERIDFLRLPMDNIPTFEKMLEDRAFRLQIVTGNEKIEHIVSRTATALAASLQDVEEGLKATQEFAVYLGEQRNQAWRNRRPDVIDIFDAMKGNAEGWYKAFVDLQGSCSGLDTLLIQLGEMVTDMDRRAGEVSRRTRFSVAPYPEPTAGTSFTSARSPEPSVESSQRSSSSMGHSGSQSSRSEAGPTPTRSPTQTPPPSSPKARDTLPVFQFRPPQRQSSFPKRGPILEIITAPEIEGEPEVPSPIEQQGLYILQPRTYTPQPPEPLPSPMVHDPPSPRLKETRKVEEAPKRTSLRQRLSLKGSNPPESIQVPPRNVNRPRYQSPQVQAAHKVPDSAYGSDVESRPPFNSVAEHLADLSLPAFPSTIPSPRSDQQYFRPVQASPHSPLQRPWTSSPAAIPRPHTSATQYKHHHAGHARNQPSAMGMSMLSTVTTMNPGNKTLKKKRSTFGWLKKAFSLSDEERAAFEARKQQQTLNLYHDSRSPKFLDGKRREEYRHY